MNSDLIGIPISLWHSNHIKQQQSYLLVDKSARLVMRAWTHLTRK